MRRQTVNISISLPRGIREQARQAAFDDNRSLSGLVSEPAQRLSVRRGLYRGWKVGWSRQGLSAAAPAAEAARPGFLSKLESQHKNEE